MGIDQAKETFGEKLINELLDENLDFSNRVTNTNDVEFVASLNGLQMRVLVPKEVVDDVPELDLIDWEFYMKDADIKDIS